MLPPLTDWGGVKDGLIHRNITLQGSGTIEKGAVRYNIPRLKSTSSNPSQTEYVRLDCALLVPCLSSEPFAEYLRLRKHERMHGLKLRITIGLSGRIIQSDLENLTSTDTAVAK